MGDIQVKFENYLTKSQLAARIPGRPVSERTLDRWHALRIGPPRIKCGRTVLYEAEAVKRWLESQTVHPVGVSR